MDPQLKSWYAHQLINLQAPEEVLLPQQSETARMVAQDVAKFRQLSSCLPDLASRLDGIALEQDSKKLLEFDQEQEPYHALVRKYRVLPVLGRSSLEQGVRVVRVLEELCTDLAGRLVRGLGECFIAKQDVIANTGDISALAGIRKDMRGIVDSYRSLRKRFEAKAIPRIESYLQLISQMDAIDRTLDGVDRMLREDHSADNFADLRAMAKAVGSGFFDAGKVRRECRASSYKEGLLRCDYYSREIEDTIANFPALKKYVGMLNAVNNALRQRSEQLNAHMGIERISISALDALFAPAVVAEWNAKLSAFSYCKPAVSQYRELLKQVSEMRDSLGSRVYALARKEVDGLSEPDVLARQDIGRTVCYLKSACNSLSNLRTIFNYLDKKEDALECERKISTFSALHNTFVDEPRDELSRSIAQMKDALHSLDKSKFDAVAKLPVIDQVSNPYIADLAKDYNALLWHVRGLMRTEPEISFKSLRRVNVTHGPRSFFAIVKELGNPRSDYLRDLRGKLLEGSVQARLSAFEDALGHLDSSSIHPEDNFWLSEVKKGYESDCANGYLSNASQLGVDNERIKKIGQLLGRFAG